MTLLVKKVQFFNIITFYTISITSIVCLVFIGNEGIFNNTKLSPSFKQFVHKTLSSICICQEIFRNSGTTRDLQIIFQIFLDFTYGISKPNRKRRW